MDSYLGRFVESAVKAPINFGGGGAVRGFAPKVLRPEFCHGPVDPNSAVAMLAIEIRPLGQKIRNQPMDVVDARAKAGREPNSTLQRVEGPMLPAQCSLEITSPVATTRCQVRVESGTLDCNQFFLELIPLERNAIETPI